jgi:hypothetical protein
MPFSKPLRAAVSKFFYYVSMTYHVNILFLEFLRTLKYCKVAKKHCIFELLAHF